MSPSENDNREDWMSPLNKIIWLYAFRQKKTVVQIRDGRRFSIDYDQIPGKAWVDGLDTWPVPCGWFDMKRVTDDMFLQESNYGRVATVTTSNLAPLKSK